MLQGKILPYESLDLEDLNNIYYQGIVDLTPFNSFALTISIK
jgi:hypothetical protein